jgi:hypothetical protein
MEPELPPARDEDGVRTEETTDAAAFEIPDVAYDGGGDHVFNTASQVEVTDARTIEGGAGTIAFWIEPAWEAFNQDHASFVRVGENGLQLAKYDNHLRFRYIDNTGNEYGGEADIGEWEPGEWRHVTATWMGGKLALYVDGGQVFLNHGPTPGLQGDLKLYVGTPASTSAVAPAQLSYLTVLNREASVDEVKQMFESGRAPSSNQ